MEDLPVKPGKQPQSRVSTKPICGDQHRVAPQVEAVLNHLKQLGLEEETLVPDGVPNGEQAQSELVIESTESSSLPPAIEKKNTRMLADVVEEANRLFPQGSIDWWQHILQFQNEWNQKHRARRIRNRDLAQILGVQEATVKNQRSRLKLSVPMHTRADLYGRKGSDR